MKKTLLAFAALAAALSADAQMVIDRTDLGYPESSFDMAEDTNVTLPNGFATGGDSITWDFSGAQSHDQSVTRFLRPQDVPAAASYPDCNIVLQEDENVNYYYFINATDSAVYNLGDNSPDPTSSQVVRFRHLVLPLQKGTNWLDEASGSTTYPGSDFGAPVDSVRVTVNGTFNSECDASGTLKLPVGQRDVLRIKTHVNIDVVIEFKTGPSGWIPSGGQNQEFLFYSFYSKQCGFRIAAMNVDPNTPNVGDLEYRSTNLLSRKEIAEAALAVYPNPAPGNSVFVEGQNNRVVSIFDLNGRQAGKATMLAGGEHRLDIGHLTPGAYMMIVVEEGGKTHTHKLIRN